MNAAASLVQALDTLDPEVSLRTREQLESFFVERPETPADDLAIALQAKKAQKILFTGHRGSGKSTELASLGLRLRKRFFVVDFSVKDTLDLFDLTYVDVLFSIQNRRVDYDVLLDSRQRELLRTVHADRRIENDEEHRVLLHTLSIIEFRNGDVWYDVNPLVEPLLSRQGSRGESDSTTQP